MEATNGILEVNAEDAAFRAYCKTLDRKLSAAELLIAAGDAFADAQGEETRAHGVVTAMVRAHATAGDYAGAAEVRTKAERVRTDALGALLTAAEVHRLAARELDRARESFVKAHGREPKPSDRYIAELRERTASLTVSR